MLFSLWWIVRIIKRIKRPSGSSARNTEFSMVDTSSSVLNSASSSIQRIVIGNFRHLDGFNLLGIVGTSKDNFIPSGDIDELHRIFDFSPVSVNSEYINSLLELLENRFTKCISHSPNTESCHRITHHVYNQPQSYMR